MNDEAIGEVTLALKNLIENCTTYAVNLYGPWEQSVPDTCINLFLYKLVENAQLKNMDWLGDRLNSVRIKSSPLSLDLYYLLTPFSNQPEEAHKMLGKVMLIFHENPILNNIHNSNFDADNPLHFKEDLATSFEKIKISLFPMDMEEMSKIWTMGDKHYKLSVAYHVSLVQLAPTVPAVPPGPPVQETGLRVTTISTPTISELNPCSGPVGSKLRIIGPNLGSSGFSTIVKIGDINITEFINDNGNDNEIKVIVPEELQKGPEQKVTVIRNGRESKPAIFRVSPWISLIKPQRGAMDNSEEAEAFPIEIHGHDFDFSDDVVVTLNIGNEKAEINLDESNEKLVKAYIPKSLQNGFHDIDLKFNDISTNKRIFEIQPLIENIDPTQGKVGDTIKINGQRLITIIENESQLGERIKIDVGKEMIISVVDDTSIPDQLTFNVPKLLGPGEYSVKVTVDGHESNIKSFEVIE